jgi:hypothetical protein
MIEVMAVIFGAIVKFDLAFADPRTPEVIRCTAWGGLILLSRCRVSIGSATSTLVQRGAFIMRIALGLAYPS